MAVSHFSEKKWKCLSIGLAAVLALGFSFPQAFAEAKDKVIFRDNGSFTYTFWQDETADGSLSTTSLFVSDSSVGTDVFLSRSISNPDGTFIDTFGFAFTTEDVLTISKKLDAASLSPIEMEIQTCTFVQDSYDCTSDTVTIQADWTGIGDVVKTTSKSNISTPDFKVKFSQTSTFGHGTATASIDDEDLGESIYAELGKFKRVEMQSGSL